jgi:phage terminase large subunit
MPFTEKKDAQILKKPYVIGADTAGTGEDYFTAKVIDNTSGKCVATLRKQHIDEDLFAEQLYCLGRFYNDALIGVETNYSTHPVRHLLSLGYENLYVSRTMSTLGDVADKHYGFITTSVSRPIIISNLVSVMRENLYLETDRQTLNEMTTFIKRNDGKSAACDGAHDDLVMASAIARYISIDYEHNMIIIDTSTEILEKSFSFSNPENSFMEW